MRNNFRRFHSNGSNPSRPPHRQGGRPGQRPPQGRGGQKGKYISADKFVNKAQPIIKIAESEPKNSFDDFAVSAHIKANIKAKGYTKPTPIQDETIPLILEGRDVVGIANTGTGKTAAFSIPFIHALMHNPAAKVLIMAPTRELAVQIQEEIVSFTRGMNLYSVLCIGGTSMHMQMQAVRRPFRILVGTPGRIKDLVMRRAINLSGFNHVVLDEMDRMLDMGFIKDITYLLDLTAKPRQTLFFSATTTREIDQLIQRFLVNPITVSVRRQETASHVEQDIIKVTSREDKLTVLDELLKRKGFDKVIIFGRTKFGVEKLSRKLFTLGFRVGSIHGDKPQSKRQMVLRQFKENKLNILVATDVAARGLDIPDVTHVINYDQPGSYEDYVHRIGRTGRADKKGYALTFVE